MSEAGECWSCGTCVPWVCPDCQEEGCSWFDDRCRRCGAARARGQPSGRRVRAILQEVADLRQEIDRRARAAGNEAGQ